MASLRLFIACTFVTSSLFAAIPIQQSAFEKKNHYVDSGVIIGGFDRGIQELLNVRGHFDKDSRVERLVLDMAPPAKGSGRVLATERPGFFHVSVQKDKKRILVDLQNVLDKTSEEKIKRAIKNSPYISDAKIYQDSITKNLTLELSTKQAVRVEVFELAGVGQPGRLVIDVK